MDQKLYAAIGANNLEAIVTTFYDLVFDDPLLSTLFRGDKSEIARKQLLFLTQFLGGPPLYTAEQGPPRMRLRHTPHRITQETKTAWLFCMQEAIDKSALSADLRLRLYQVFPPVAQHMVNT